MALFTDGDISTIADLLGYESEVLDVAAAEGIDLNIKLALAQEELAIELQGFLPEKRRPNVLDEVVVTQPLRKWHTFWSLVQVYRDAYHKELNDRYQVKAQEYKDVARWAEDMLFQTGVGVVDDPLPRAAKPQLSMAPGSQAASTYFVRVSWLNGRGEEGAPSEVVALSAPNGTSLIVTAMNPPATASAWNVYMGFSATNVSLQNDVGLQLTQPWTAPTSGIRQGRPPGNGQMPQRYLRTARVLQRG
ncbi:MAG: hypothetical protein ABSG25_13240 [Bryobacteraceae bacterium]